MIHCMEIVETTAVHLRGATVKRNCFAKIHGPSQTISWSRKPSMSCKQVAISMILQGFQCSFEPSATRSKNPTLQQ